LEIATRKFRFLGQQFGKGFVNLRVPLGEALAQFVGNAFDFKVAPCAIANPVTERPQFASEFVIVGVLGKFPGPQQFVILERLPPAFHRVERRVEHNAVRMQMRIEGARRVVCEQRRNEVPGHPVVLCATRSNASGSERLEFPQRGTHSARMGFKNPFVFTQQSRDGNRLWRREREVVEYPPIGCAPVTFRPRGVQSLCERLTRGGILILAQPQEIIGSDFPGQSKPFRTDANPFAGHPLPFVVVIANAKVFLEVLLRVSKIVLRLCRDHAGHSVTAIRLRSVSATQKSGLTLTSRAYRP